MNERQGPVRMCVVCKRRFAKSQLMRHVPAPEGVAAGNGLEADKAQTRPGRGWYVYCDKQDGTRVFDSLICFKQDV